MGEQSDEAVYTKLALRPLSRKSMAGGQTINYTYAADKMTSDMGGKNTSTNIAGPYMLDGVGNDMVLARMPLNEGYEAGFYVATQDGKVSLNKLTVKGKETIAGTECYKCELVNTEDPTDLTTYYIGVADKTPYKIIAPMAGAPGAVVTMELKK